MAPAVGERGVEARLGADPSVVAYGSLAQGPVAAALAVGRVQARGRALERVRAAELVEAAEWVVEAVSGGLAVEGRVPEPRVPRRGSG